MLLKRLYNYIVNSCTQRNRVLLEHAPSSGVATCNPRRPAEGRHIYVGDYFEDYKAGFPLHIGRWLLLLSQIFITSISNDTNTNDAQPDTRQIVDTALVCMLLLCPSDFNAR